MQAMVASISLEKVTLVTLLVPWASEAQMIARCAIDLLAGMDKVPAI
ncbi:Uncharacterised protein [Chlamydia trachomatis]|nr:Uncharacterised protein [Chlamydia trachomatis]